jgi:hypothetical protein
MGPFSYACYPPQVVHGASVSVPGGYLLYLRTSGSTELYPVSEPVMEEAYHHPDSQVLEKIVVLEHTRRRGSGKRVAQASPILMHPRVLRAKPEGDAAVTLWEFDSGARNLFQHFPPATPLEVLLVRPGSEAAEGMDSRYLAYGCYGPGDARPSIDAEGDVVALVHAGSWA